MAVFEKSDRLGGQINIASVPPRKDEILRSVQYYEKFLPGKVDIQLNHEPAMDELNGWIMLSWQLVLTIWIFLCQ